MVLGSSKPFFEVTGLTRIVHRYNWQYRGWSEIWVLWCANVNIKIQKVQDSSHCFQYSDVTDKYWILFLRILFFFILSYRFQFGLLHLNYLVNRLVFTSWQPIYWGCKTISCGWDADVLTEGLAFTTCVVNNTTSSAILRKYIYMQVHLSLIFLSSHSFFFLFCLSQCISSVLLFLLS